MTSNKATKTDEIIKKPQTDQDHRRTNSSIVNRRGFEFSRWRSKAFRTTSNQKEETIEDQKEPSRNHEEHLKNLIPEI